MKYDDFLKLVLQERKLRTEISEKKSLKRKITATKKVTDKFKKASDDTLDKLEKLLEERLNKNA